MSRITLLGTGMMGTALAVPLLDRGHRLRGVGTHLDEAIVEALRREGVHPGLRVRLPPGGSYHPLAELAECLEGAELVVLGVSSHGVGWAARTLAPLLPRGVPVLMVAKGLRWERDHLTVLPDHFRRELGPAGVDQPVAAIAGPCIAGELARRVQTCPVFTGTDRELLEELVSLVRTDYYSPRVSLELVGCAVCAALKNGYALGVGFGAGLHERGGGERGASVAWHNLEAAVFAQAIAEMARLVELAGGAPHLAHGLPGAGDLMVTCQGGRTGRFGRWLGLGLSLPEAIARMEGATLECLDVIACLSEALPCWEAAGRPSPEELPLLRHLAEVVLQGRPVQLPLERLH